MKYIATVICSRCTKNKKLYGIRAQKDSDGRGWSFTWCFPLKEEVAHNEGFTDTNIDGPTHNTATFPGCPYCKARELIYCSACNKLACYSGEGSVTCPWCGNRGEITTGAWDDLKGGGY